MRFRLCKRRFVIFGIAVLAFAGTFTAAAESMPAASAGASAVTILGDADCNGVVVINDVTCIQRRIAEIFDDGARFSETAADVDGNGKINIDDATCIQRWLAEYEIAYPIGKPVEAPELTAIAPTTAAPVQRPTDSEGWGRDVFRP